MSKFKVGDRVTWLDHRGPSRCGTVTNDGRYLGVRNDTGNITTFFSNPERLSLIEPMNDLQWMKEPWLWHTTKYQYGWYAHSIRIAPELK